MPNRLANETSPYLLQHQHNPVDWHPWGPEALAKAKAENKPILLSVGYSACHWCHVMERESFENPAIAADMNAGFVCIKVDREERPDIDEIYMRAVAAFTGGHGGWPMTVFLTPEGAPYFGGTYFPPEPRHRMPSFPQVLDHASRVYRERPDDLERITSELVAYLDQSGRMPGPDAELSDAWLERIVTAADLDFDAEHAGFKGAPKFPPHGTLAVLLAAHHRSGRPRPLELATTTLDAMIKGGMYDLLGGGFARYSVDAEWRVPHFEKMLYDNAQLLPIYVDAFKLTGRPWYRRVVEETAEYVLREMTLPEGGFCASQDADSEGVEGKYFAWTPRELRDALGIVEGTRAATLLQVTDEGTFEHGASVLRLESPLESLSEADRSLLQRALPLLRAARSQRVAPGRDDKVVTAWNALMISALARAGAALAEPRYVAASARAAEFLLSAVMVGGRLQRTWKDGRAHLLAYLDDHSFLVDALVDLWEATFEPRWLREANRLADTTLDLFWDGDDGGLFYTGRDAEALVTRSKRMLGGAEPSGNGVAARAFLRLAALCGRDDLRQRAVEILRRYQPLLDRAPRGLGAEALAGAWATGPVSEIAIVGEPAAPMLAEIRARYLPFTVLAHVTGAPDLALLPWLEGKVGPVATAFVCEGGTCQAPVRTPAELAEQLAPRRALPTRPRTKTRLHAPDLPADPALWLNTDRPFPLSALRGNVVVLDFWTYCCINCMHVLPELAAIEARFAGRPVVVLGVHSAKFPAEQDRQNVERAIARHHVRHPVVLDSDHAVWQEYAVRSWPTIAVIDPTGRIAWVEPGETNREVLGRVVADLLDEAEAAGTLASPAWQVPTAADVPAALRHPAKVHVYPAAAAQATGADPFGPEARLYVADTGAHRIVECALTLDAEGWPTARRIRTFGDGQPGLVDGNAPRFRAPQGISRAGDTLWVADTENHALRAVDLNTGAVRTVAGTGSLGISDALDPTLPLEAGLRSPWDVATVGPDGEPPAPGTPGEAQVVLVAMAGAHQIWMYLPANDTIGPFVGSGREDHVDGEANEAALAQPSGLEAFGRFLFFADSETSSIRAYDLAERTVGTFVGAGLFDFGDRDGAGPDVRLQHPLGVTIADGQLYVADTFNHKIKSISLDGGRTRTLAGGDVGELCEPGGIAAAGDFVILADTNNHRIRAMRRTTGELRDVELG